METNVSIAGDFGSGKTSLFRRYNEEYYPLQPYLSKIAPEFFFKRNFVVNDAPPRDVRIGDMTCERFITQSYFRHAHGILLVYDTTNAQTFSNLMSDWYPRAKESAGMDIVFLVVGTKCDLEAERQVTAAQAQEFADHIGCGAIEVSARTGVNVDRAFELVVAGIDDVEKREAPARGRAGGVKLPLYGENARRPERRDAWGCAC